MTLARRMIVLGLLAILSYGFAGASRVGWAHDHAPPKMILRTSTERQTGNNYHYWWSKKSGDGCVGSDAVGPFEFPSESLEAADDDEVWITIRKKQKTKTLRLKAWMLVDNNGQPVGEAEAVTISKVKKDNRWRVGFTPPFAGDNYLRLFGQWRDRQGCEDMQGGYWTFHLSVSVN